MEELVIIQRLLIQITSRTLIDFTCGDPFGGPANKNECRHCAPLRFYFHSLLKASFQRS